MSKKSKKGAKESSGKTIRCICGMTLTESNFSTVRHKFFCPNCGGDSSGTESGIITQGEE